MARGLLRQLVGTYRLISRTRKVFPSAISSTQESSICFTVNDLKKCNKLLHNLILQRPGSTKAKQSKMFCFPFPGGHHCILIDKIENDPDKALFFVRKTIENGWSRSMLLNFLDTNLYERSGKAVHNFETALPSTDSDLAKDLLKDPYNFDFLTLTDNYKEKDLQKALEQHVTNFLIELGTCFRGPASSVGSRR